jgi:hypothetical protein
LAGRTGNGATKGNLDAGETRVAAFRVMVAPLGALARAQTYNDHRNAP